MLNKNQVAEIRTCQRIKFDQALYILTMYQKKIRNQIKFDNDKPIDVDKQYDEKIIRSWNGKWKMDLTKPLLNCVTSVYPRVILDINSKNQMMEEQDNDLQQFNKVMLSFIRRMRAEHEDQSNFKIIQVDIKQKNSKFQKFLPYAKTSFKDFLQTIQNIYRTMSQSIHQNSESVQIQQNEAQNYYLEIGSRIQDMLQVTTQTSQNLLSENLLKFISTCVGIFDNIKQSQHGSTLLTVQPKLNEFTYLLHPLFFPIYSFLLKQKDEHKPKSENKQFKEEAGFPFRNFFSSNTSSLSKVVFLNLDGYESEFNIQFARCFRKNMLYISFPKEDIHFANDLNSVYQQRLYKKIMYNWQKNKMQFEPNVMDQQGGNTDKIYYITKNIQNYHGSVQKFLYKFDNNFEDVNRNMFIFPLRLNTLNQSFNNLVPQDQDDTIEVYQSYAILQIFKYFLVNQIKQFGPTFIIVSHSGRLNLEESHFVQIIQQLTKLSHYKLIYFPNLTTRFCPKQKKGIDHEMNIANIDYLHRHNDQQININQDCNISFDFFNKIARFLKVSSGTHSLVKNFEQEDLISKHRNLKILKRINKLMEVLGNQYENIQRIRFKSSEIDLIPKLYEKDSEKIVKAFQKLVPFFYMELYQLIESIITVCQMPSQKKAYQDIKKYNINPEGFRNNYVIKQLIDFIRIKIIVRNARNQNQRKMIAFQKMKKYLNCQKQKHFLQISQQRYQDSVLLHFKNSRSHQMFENITQSKPNLSGLVDISFNNPNKDIKECMHIYDSTQVLYKLNQSDGAGPIPILLMSHLPLQKKNSSKFDNYCAFLNRDVLSKLSNTKNSDQGVQKIHEQKKIKPYLIKFFDHQNRQIIQNKFQFRVQWNYCQSNNYMLLYWPQLFNFVQAVAYKLQGKNYEPPVLNQIFIGKKEVKNDIVCFYKASIPDDILPRTGCSAYQFGNFIFLFGGFYDRTNNYLSLQRDITRMNLQHYNHEQNRKIQVTNIKDELYQAISIKNSYQRPPNSYVRPRRQFQFYDMQDLSNQFVQQQGVRTVAMMGGVGQNFIHPFSLLTYYYYELRFEQQTGKLINVKKNLVYNRSIPVNISRPSKNMGIIKTPIRSKNQSNGKAIIVKPQLTEPHSYARFRIVYKIQGGQLKYKFQYVFSQKDCKMLKQELRRCQEQKYEVTDISNFRLEKIDGQNHLFMTQKPGLKQVVHLRLQVDGILDKKQQQFKLTHDSVSFLNIINGNYICAIVKHPIFTQDKSLLVQCKVKSIQNENLTEDEAPYVSLKPIHSDLKGDLTLHIIQASNVNLIYVLHGHRLYNSNKIYQYQITHNRKSGMKSVTQIKPKKPHEQLAHKQIPSCCFSTFFYKKIDNIRNQIVCESYLSFQQDKHVITKVCEYFDPSDSTNSCWKSRDPIKRYVFCLKNSSRPINLERLTFLDFFRQEKLRLIIVQYNKKKYLITISQEEKTIEQQQTVIVLQQINELYIRSLQEQQCERGTILLKKPSHYSDRGYEMSQ